MILLDYTARTPIFEQIKEQVIFLIQKGVYKPRDQLPSIRSLAAELGINVNTVKRAFAELEESGVVYTEAGRGVFISENAVGNENVRREALATLSSAVYAAASKGIGKEEILRLTESVCQEAEVEAATLRKD